MNRFARFLDIAQGSASELEYHLLLSVDLKLLDPDRSVFKAVRLSATFPVADGPGGLETAIRTLGGHRRFRASEVRQYLEQAERSEIM